MKVSLLMLLVLAGCTVGPDYVPVEPNVPQRWHGAMDEEALDAHSLARWWETLNDSTLNALVSKAVAANLDLRYADAQLRQARAQRGVASNAQFPTVDATTSAVRAGSSSNVGSGSTTELYSASFDAGWEVDIFGGGRRTVEAADADLQVASESRRDVLISILAEVGLNYVELRAYQAQQASAVENLALQAKTVEVVQAQFDGGRVNRLDLDRAIANRESTRAEIPQWVQSVAQAKNRLAVLVGEPPGMIGESLDTAAPVPAVMKTVAVGVPADVLRRRPDVRRAERQLAAETARVGVATAELYPKLTLSGTIGLESLSLSSLTEADSLSFGIGPSLRMNVFDRGRTRAQIEIQNAVQEQALIGYEAAVLQALEEVENAVMALTQEQLRHESLSESATASRRAAEVAKARYEAGATNFLTLLDAQRTLLGAQSRLLASDGALATNLIRLYKALGGGWVPD